MRNNIIQSPQMFTILLMPSFKRLCSCIAINLSFGLLLKNAILEISEQNNRNEFLETPQLIGKFSLKSTPIS